MEKFSLEKYLEETSRKIVTRDGRPVRILCTNAKAKDGCCIIAAIETDGEEEGYQFYEDGRAYSSKSSIEDCADLFFADEEELSEFEKEVSNLINFYGNEVEEITVTNAGVKEIALKLLDLAKKEICLTCKEYSRGYQKGLKLGREDVLKDLPKWRKLSKLVCFDRTNSGYFAFIGNDTSKPAICCNDYYISLADLEKLPKEE